MDNCTNARECVLSEATERMERYSIINAMRPYVDEIVRAFYEGGLEVSVTYDDRSAIIKATKNGITVHTVEVNPDWIITVSTVHSRGGRPWANERTPEDVGESIRTIVSQCQPVND